MCSADNLYPRLVLTKRFSQRVQLRTYRTSGFEIGYHTTRSNCMGWANEARKDLAISRRTLRPDPVGVTFWQHWAAVLGCCCLQWKCSHAFIFARLLRRATKMIVEDLGIGNIDEYTNIDLKENIDDSGKMWDRWKPVTVEQRSGTGRMKQTTDGQCVSRQRNIHLVTAGRRQHPLQKKKNTKCTFRYTVVRSYLRAWVDLVPTMWHFVAIA